MFTTSLSQAQILTALRLFYDEGKSLGAVAREMELPRGAYDLSPWICSQDCREEMRKQGRWKPNERDLAWHMRMMELDG